MKNKKRIIKHDPKMNWIKSITKTIKKEQFVLLLCLLVYSSNSFSQTTNPAISVADLVSGCPDNGLPMPKIFLCLLMKTIKHL